MATSTVYNPVRKAASPPYRRNVKYINAARVSEITLKSQATIYRWSKEGVIPAYQPPGTKSWLYIEEEILAWIADGKNEAA